jgi:hypothetical protein
VTVLPRIPPQTLADLSSLGVTFFVNGIVLVVPKTASSSDLFEAKRLIDRLGREQFVCEGSDQGFGT